MTCKHLPDCDFIDKICSTMPKTSKRVKQTCSGDKKKCVKNRLAKTMIEHIEDGRLSEEK
jgi:hypothetical protein